LFDFSARDKEEGGKEGEFLEEREGPYLNFNKSFF